MKKLTLIISILMTMNVSSQELRYINNTTENFTIVNAHYYNDCTVTGSYYNYNFSMPALTLGVVDDLFNTRPDFDWDYVDVQHPSSGTGLGVSTLSGLFAASCGTGTIIATTSLPNVAPWSIPVPPGSIFFTVSWTSVLNTLTGKYDVVIEIN